LDKGAFEEYLESRYREQIAWYDRKSVFNGKWFKVFQWGTITLASLTPVIVVIGFESSNDYAKWLPVLTSVLVAIFASAQKTFKFEENWINYRTTCETLKKEIYLYKAGVGEYSTTRDREGLFVERVEGLISRENTLWLITSERSEKKEKS
jgi:Ni/Fe-hydrogenase subunit HybB-like protein